MGTDGLLHVLDLLAFNIIERANLEKSLIVELTETPHRADEVPQALAQRIKNLTHLSDIDFEDIIQNWQR